MMRIIHLSMLVAALALSLCGLPTVAMANPTINEFMASNNSTLADEDGVFSDWIEIYNPTGSTINLEGWHLTDEADNLNKWEFPAETLASGAYLVVFASGNDRAVVGSELHTDFKLSANGEYLALVDPDGLTIVQEFSPEYPPQVEDVSYGLGSTSSTPVTYINATDTGFAHIPTIADAGDEATWMLNSYVPSGWVVGTMGVGYDNSTEYPPYFGIDFSGDSGSDGDMKGENESAWIRIPFTVADPSAVLSLTLRMRYDDGFAAYINGAFVTSENEENTIPLPWDAGASTIHSDSAAVNFVDYDASAQKGSLVAGVNTLAIHGLNRNLTSSDFLIQSELHGTVDAGGGEAELRFFTSPTPGWSNATGILGYIDEVIFSDERGFYDMAFAVTLATDVLDTTIRYTTDGTEPTASHGTVYSGSAVPILTTTCLRAIAYKSGYTSPEAVTHTYIFLEDVFDQTDNESGRGFPSSWYAGSSSTGSYDRRTRPADYEMDPEIVDDALYGPQMIAAMTDIPTVVLTFDPNDLWNSSTGIYPNSIKRASSSSTWEKAASMELIDPDGIEPGFCINAGARIMGELARWPGVNDKQSFRVVFQAEWGPTKLRYNIFDNPDVEKFDTLVLRANWGDSWIRDDTRGDDMGISWLREGPDDSLFLRDSHLHKAFRDTGNVGVRHRFVHLYLNGVYWGLYGLNERPDNSFAAEHHGGDKDEYDVLKGTLGDVVRNGTLQDGSKTAWNYMFRQYFDTDGSNENIDGQVTTITDNDLIALEAYMDVDQYIDYMITLWTYNRQDFPRKNWYTFCRRNPSGGAPLKPFTFHVWDSEASMGQGVDDGSRLPTSRETGDRWNNTDSRNDTGPVRIYRRLITNATFRRRWGDRAQQLMLGDGPLTAANNIIRLAEAAAEIDLAIIGESARWGDSSHDWNAYEGDSSGSWTDSMTRADWVAERDLMTTAYLPTRTTEALNQMIERGLYPSLDPVLFSPNGGEFDVPESVTLTNTNGMGFIWYTDDGSDPLDSPTRQVYPMSPIALTDSVVIKARVDVSGSFSALAEAGFMPTGGPTLAVSEIMYNPVPPQVDQGFLDEDYEFIEIVNTGAGIVDLTAIEFVDGILFKFADGLLPVIAPGQHIVVVKNMSAFQARYGSGIAIAGTYTGLLNNGGETVSLAAAGMAFSTFTYSDANNWPGRADGRGASLEVADPMMDLNDDDAWRSSSEYNGSPGTAGTGPIDDIVINEVLAHTDSPDVDYIELYNASGGTVNLDGWYLSDFSGNFLKYRITGVSLADGEYVTFDETDFNATGLTPDPGDDDPADFGLDGAHGDDVWLMEADGSGNLTRFVDHVEFGGSLNGEAFGRWPNITGELYPMVSQTDAAANSGPRLGSVLISEVLYNPGGAELDDLEFVEVYNSGVAAADLTGYRLNDGVDYDFDAGVVLAAGARVVVLSFNPVKPENAARVAAFQAAYGIDGSVVLVGGWSGKLDNDGERVQLQKADTPPLDEPYYTPHVIEDEVIYDTIAPWPIDLGLTGDSLHRNGGGPFGHDATSWSAAIPSPGTGTDVVVVPGDADGDGDVDLDDFVILKSNFGTPTGMTQATGDFDGDGDVDLDDFVILKTNFGTVS